MQLKPKSTKRRLLTFALFFILVSVLAYGTIAYFTDRGSSTSLITAGNIDIKLIQQQKFGDQTYNVPFDNVTDLLPGESVSCVVSVENCGGNTAYIRVDVELVIKITDGFSIATAPTNPVIVDFNEEDWTKHSDGYYYYNEPVEPGMATKPLFTTIAFTTGMDNTFENSTANLRVLAYATQVANNGENVFDAEGWPEPKD